MRFTDYLLMGALAPAAFAVAALPTRLIANPWFKRMTPPRTSDYVILAISAVLFAAGVVVARRVAQTSGRFAVGGSAVVLAVGCALCNKIVVLLLGTGGAVGLFGPIQPVIGAAGIAVLATALWRGLARLGSPACPVPTTDTPDALAHA